MRCLCGHNSRLGLVLDVPTSLPSQAEVVRCGQHAPRPGALQGIIVNSLALGFLDAGMSGISSADQQPEERSMMICIWSWCVLWRLHAGNLGES